MKQRTKLYFISGGLTFLGLVMALPALNLYVDQYRVLFNAYGTQYAGVHSNGAFMATSYLLDEGHPHFSCYLFGSSRVGNLEQSRLGKRCFNYAYTKGVPHSHLYHLKLLLSRGVKIKRVYIGLDEFSYTIDPGLIFKKPNKRDWAIIVGFHPLLEFQGTHKDAFDRLRRASAQRIIPASEHRSRLVRTPSQFITETDRIPQTVQEVAAIRDLAREHRIEVTWFINPIHYKMLLAIDNELFARFKKALSREVSFRDFSEVREAHTADKLWLEATHYTPEMGDNLIRDLHSGTDYRVTRDNVDAVLERQKRKLIHLLPALTRKEGLLLTDQYIGREAYINAPGEERPLEIFYGRDVEVLSPTPGGGRFHARSLNAGVRLSPVAVPDEGLFLVRVRITPPSNTLFWVHYEASDESGEESVIRQRIPISPRTRHVFIALSGKILKDGLRLIAGKVSGVYAFGPCSFRRLRN